MTKLRVLSYNLHSLRDDRRALAEVVRGVAPDVAILQEAPRRFRWRQKSAPLARFERQCAIAAWRELKQGGGPPPLRDFSCENVEGALRRSCDADRDDDS